MIQWLTIVLITGFAKPEQVILDEIVKVSAPRVIVQVDRNSVMNVNIEVKNGYHIQAYEVNDEFIIPTSLEINGDKEIVLKGQVFPSAKKFKLQGTDKYLDVYDGTFEIQAFFTTPKTIQKKVYRMNGKFRCQACDSIRCFSPKTVAFLIRVDVR